MRTAVVSGADARYGLWLLNLLGSIQRRSAIFDQIIAFDLGLTSFQRRLLDEVRGVDVRTVPAFVPHWRQGRTWKTWIWTHVDADVVVWLDAGITVLRPLTDLVQQSRERGYFVVSQGIPNSDCIPSDYYGQYEFPHALDEEPTIAAGIIGFATESEFFSNVILPTYEDAVLGRSIGFSVDEIDKINRGLDYTSSPILRDCRHFRHEQTLLSIHFYTSTEGPFVNDVYKYGGWKSPHDHPEQVIWSHRRRGDFRFLPLIQYHRRMALRGRAWGTATYLRWFYLNHRWLLRPSIYLRVIRRMLSRVAARLRRESFD